jgi:hypothetical protein
VVVHDVASGDQEEEWQWFAVVKKIMMATVVFALFFLGYIF